MKKFVNFHYFDLKFIYNLIILNRLLKLFFYLLIFLSIFIFNLLIIKNILLSHF